MAQSKPNFCSNCGEKITGNPRFRPNCGQAISSAPESSVTEQTEQAPKKPVRKMSDRAMVIWGIISIIVLVLATYIPDIITAAQVVISSAIVGMTAVFTLAYRVSKRKDYLKNYFLIFSLICGASGIIASLAFFDIKILLNRSFNGTYTIQSTEGQCSDGSNQAQSLNPVSSTSLTVENNTIKDPKRQKDIAIDKNGDAKQDIDVVEGTTSVKGNITMHFNYGKITGKWDLSGTAPDANNNPVNFQCNGTFEGNRK